MVIQSSSATTVMVVGFVNAGLMNLAQAAGIIMGANIGRLFSHLSNSESIGENQVIPSINNCLLRNRLLESRRTNYLVNTGSGENGNQRRKKSFRIIE